MTHTLSASNQLCVTMFPATRIYQALHAWDLPPVEKTVACSKHGEEAFSLQRTSPTVSLQAQAPPLFLYAEISQQRRRHRALHWQLYQSQHFPFFLSGAGENRFLLSWECCPHMLFGEPCCCSFEIHTSNTKTNSNSFLFFFCCQNLHLTSRASMCLIRPTSQPKCHLSIHSIDPFLTKAQVPVKALTTAPLDSYGSELAELPASSLLSTMQITQNVVNVWI